MEPGTNKWATGPEGGTCMDVLYSSQASGQLLTVNMSRSVDSIARVTMKLLSMVGVPSLRLTTGMKERPTLYSQVHPRPRHQSTANITRCR